MFSVLACHYFRPPPHSNDEFRCEVDVLLPCEGRCALYSATRLFSRASTIMTKAQQNINVEEDWWEILNDIVTMGENNAADFRIAKLSRYTEHRCHLFEQSFLQN